MVYLVYYYDTTPAEASIDHKAHRHKYYLCPTPKNLRRVWGYIPYWKYTQGKRDAIRFTSKREALRIAKKHNANIEAIEKNHDNG